MYHYRKHNIDKALAILERAKFMLNQSDVINLEHLITRSRVETKSWLKKSLSDVELKNSGFSDHFSK